MRFNSSFLALLGAAAWTASAVAGPVTLSGSGTVNSNAGRLPSTGLVPNGSPLAFSFSFDPDDAVLFDSGEDFADYEVPVSAFSGNLGSYNFPLSSNPALTPVVEIYKGFSFFGGNASEPSIGFAFFLLGTPTVAGGATPFAGAAGSSQQLAIYGIFRDVAGNAPVTLDSLIGRGDPSYRMVEYGTRDATVRQSGLLLGDYTGGFTIAAAVPEPASWALMIMGFGAVGNAMRRRSAVQTSVSFA
ncbi:PEPxxWA-CTERM sorting domain-containing protein [Sphingomonas sp. Tas61C01]|uniref:PEPxxWA-CTERM sorting domain-containing protein n=1 Tax=Sphingomonas sp. Tas61C01 TaxID=3458297 RepID=UPI00403ED334